MGAQMFSDRSKVLTYEPYHYPVRKASDWSTSVPVLTLESTNQSFLIPDRCIHPMPKPNAALIIYESAAEAPLVPREDVLCINPRLVSAQAE
jgi:hypothetical protein